MRFFAPQEVYVSFYGDVLEYREVLDLSAYEDPDTIMDNTLRSLKAAGIPEDAIQVEWDTDVAEVSYELGPDFGVEVDDALAMAALELLLVLHGRAGGEAVDQAYYMVKALAADVVGTAQE